MVDLENVRQQIANVICDDIEPMFTKDMRITLVARHVSNPGCHLTVTNDNIHKVAVLLASQRPGTDGLSIIAAERERQVAKKGYTTAHDDGHEGGEIADAAAVYAVAAGAITRGASPSELHSPEEDTFSTFCGFDAETVWPWAWADLKLSPNPVRNLAKAGALIAAEIDRLLRLRPELKPAVEDKSQLTFDSL